MEFTHFNGQGRAHMVDVTEKSVTDRRAVACGRVRMAVSTLDLLESGGIKKGDVLTVAQVAGVMGAKRTSELIPMCHPVQLTGVELLFETRREGETGVVEIRAVTRCAGQTGVEMEALTAVSVAALTVYDMCKALQRDIVIEKICLLEKSGGKSGVYTREATDE